MAGSYPDAPGRRLAWHADGTVAWYRYQSTQGEWGFLGAGMTFTNSATRAILNAEGDTLGLGSQGAATFFAAIFPEPRDIVGWYLHYDSQTSPGTLRQFQWSADSTNGVSGTWTTIVETADKTDYASNRNRYRTEITSYSASAVRSMRFIIVDISAFDEASQLYAFHVYGAISAGETPDRLLFINQDTGLEFDAVHDWGDVPRGIVLHKDIKVKNNSATLSASDIDFDFGALTGTSDTWYDIRDSGGAFGTTLNVAGPLAAGASYPAADVLTIRLTVAGNENLGLQSAWLSAFVNTWA